MEKRKLVIQIDKEKCTGCGECVKTCTKINHPKLCSGCGKCAKVCPSGAIILIEKKNNNKTFKTMKTRALRFTFMFLLAAAGLSAITMFLWNVLLPGIFGIVCINFWQALGLLSLSRILFGGVGAGVMDHFHHHRDNAINEKWKKMTPEQRKQFIDRRMHFGFGHHYDKCHCDMKEHEEAERKDE